MTVSDGASEIPPPPGWALFCLALGVFLLTSRGIQVGDALVHLDTARGLVERGGVALSFSGGGEETCGLVARGDDGASYSSLGPGMALAALPLVAAGSLLAPRNCTAGADRLGQDMQRAFEELPAVERIRLFRKINRDPRAWAFALLDPLCGAGVVLLLARLLLVLGLSAGALLFSSLVLMLASPLAVYAGSGWTQPLVALLLLGATLAWVQWLRRRRPADALVVGAWLAGAVLVRPDCLVMAVVFTAAMLSVRGQLGWRKLLGQLLGFSLPLGMALLLLAGWNLLRFGSLAPPACSLQLGGWSWRVFPSAFAGLLLSPNNGLVWYLPVVVVLAWALRPLWRSQRALLLLILALATAHWLLYSFWWDWNGRMSYGPRRLVPVIALLLVPVALVWQQGRWRRALALGLAVAGLLVQLPGLLLSAQHLPDVLPQQAWSVASWVTGWTVLLGHAWSVPSSSLWPDAVACLSGFLPPFLAGGVVSLVAGCWGLFAWARKAVF